jgi:hypothetical protein
MPSIAARIGLVIFSASWLFSASAKLMALGAFSDVLSAQPLISPHLINYAVIYIPLFELTLSLAILWRPLRHAGLYSSVFALLVFTAGLIFMDNGTDCGCLGTFIAISRPVALCRNVVLLAMAIALIKSEHLLW